MRESPDERSWWYSITRFCWKQPKVCREGGGDSVVRVFPRHCQYLVPGKRDLAKRRIARDGSP